jgi:hypothetical protein
MILNYIKQIGKAIQEDYSSFLKELRKYSSSVNEDLIHYIKDNYKNYTSKIDKYVAINIYIDEFIERLNQFSEKLQNSNLEDLITDKNINKKFKKSKRLQVFEEIVSKTDSNLFDDLESIISFNIREFDPKNNDDIRLLLGNQIGTKTYFSPVLYQSVVRNQVPEFPLWKINLSIQGKNYKEFFNIVPSVLEYGRLKEKKAKNIIKTFSSEIFIKLINKWLKNKNMDSGKYYFLLIFGSGKKLFYDYPIEDANLVEYYLDEMEESGEKGYCQICGGYKKVIDGPMSDIGFYTNDQKGFVPIFFDKTYKICNDCSSFLTVGLNFLQENLEFYLKSRGKNKNPLSYYLIPYNQDLELLKELLMEVKNIRSKEINKKYVIKQDRINNIRDSDLIVEKIKENEQSKNITQIVDGLDFLGYDFKKKYSLLIIIFYHPDGQSGSFHNITNIIHLNYFQVEKILKALAKAKLHNKSLKLKSLYYIFGDYRMEKYVSSILSLTKINRRRMFQDAYLNIKEKFLQDILNPDELNETKPTIFQFLSYLYIISELNLI